MPYVTGSLATFGAYSLQPYSPRLQFIPSGPGMTQDGKLRASQPVEAVIGDDNTFSVYLVHTTAVRPVFWYEVKVTWLDAEGNFIREDWFPWTLTVPEAGGDITDLLNIPLSYGDVWVSNGGVEPPAAKSGDLIFDPITNDLLRVL